MSIDASVDEPLRAQDAFFVHDATPLVARQLGAVLLLDDAAAVPLQQLGEHIARLICDRAPRLPMLSRRLEERAEAWPRWLPVDWVSGDEHLVVRTIGTAARCGWRETVEDFFGTPLATDRPPWLLHLVRDAATGRTAVLAKMHHALGDGVAMTDTLVRLLSDAEPPGAPAPTRAARPVARTALRRRLARAGLVLRGLRTLAPVGLTPAQGLESAKTSLRRYASVELPAAQVRSVAREFDASTSAVLLTVVAEALHRLRAGDGDALHGQQLRVMVPRSTRPARSGTDGGNWTVAVSLDLPVGPMPPARRLGEVAARLTALDRSGQPAAVAAVLAGLRRLPSRLQTRLVGTISGRRFFDLIVSVLPGSRRVHRVCGCRVSAVFPILPLGRVGLAVGLINWADVVGVGITADAGVLHDAEDLAECLRAAFDELCSDRPTSWAAAG